jgi:nitroreductase
VIEDCLRLAQQAPSGSNAQKWHFVIVMDREKREALGDLWREGGERYLAAAEAEPGPSQRTSACLVPSVISSSTSTKCRCT